MFSKIIFVVVLSLYFDEGQSIRCYDCNSANNSMCLDPTLYDKESLQKYLPSVECSYGLHPQIQKKFFCRKILQTLLRKGHDSHVRVTRGCGWIPHRKPCYKADNEDHLETVCQCYEDNCNGVARVEVAGIMILLFAFISHCLF